MRYEWRLCPVGADNGDMTSVTLGVDEAAYLAAYLRRLVQWDASAVVRVQVSGSSVGVFGAPPFDCISFVAVPILGSDRSTAVDEVVSAGRLRDVIGDVSSGSRRDARVVTLPDSVGPVASLAVLPPRGPWLPAERGIAGDVRPRVAAAVEEFRRRSEANPGPAADLLAQEVWDKPGWGGLKMRAVHAASLLGLLPHDGLRVETATCEGWKRLSAPGGQIFVRTSSLPPRLSLAVSRAD